MSFRPLSAVAFSGEHRVLTPSGSTIQMYSVAKLPMTFLGVLRTRPSYSGLLHGSSTVILTSRTEPPRGHRQADDLLPPSDTHGKSLGTMLCQDIVACKFREDYQRSGAKVL